VRRIYLSTLVAAICVLGVQAFPKNRIETGRDVIQAMHDRYAKTWYRTLTFVQKSTTFKPDGTSESKIWYEAMSVPGRLRIDFDPVKDGNGVLFANDKQIVFKDGKIANSRDRIHPLMVLGFDVYLDSVAQTIAKLEKLKIDLNTFHEDTWQGSPAYVVGAKAGDVTTPQFWIDKKNLLFIRLIEKGGPGGASVQETQFNKYQPVKGGWVSPEVVLLVDGKRVFQEDYSDIRTNVKLDDNLFDPQHWTDTHWR
jgi:outer membrane lipoprotein-sorting protein